MSQASPPVLLSLMMCDWTIREAATNKISLIGTFNNLFARTFPCTHPSFWVYVAITDGRGKVPCCLRMVPMAGGKEVFSLKGQVDFNDPASVAELVFQLQQVKFEIAGDYSIEFIANGELLGSRKLRVEEAPKNG